MPYSTILVVDPDENVRHTIVKILHQSGYIVASAANACAAIDILLDRPFDLVCLDIILPDMAIDPLLSRIYELDPRMPVLIITAYPAISTIIDFDRCRKWRYLLKPVDPVLFLDNVRRALKQHL